MSSQNERLKEQPTPLADLVAFQPGSIVSRTIIDRDSGSITLFAFDKGQQLSEHTTPFDALVFVLEGHMEIQITDTSHDLRAGEMIIMPANKPHAVKAKKQCKMLLTMIQGET